MDELRQTEAQFQGAIIDLAQRLGWLVAHFRPARTADGGWRTAVAADGAGYPDLTMVRRERLIFAEVKTVRGRVRSDQERWLNALMGAHGEVYVWRPADWPEIEATLR